MGIDLTGGKADDREFVFATQPDDPEMRESVNAWIWDSGTEVGMPRIGVEAVADQWDTHDIQVNIGTGDGRVFNMFAPGKVHDPLGADGKPRRARRGSVVVRAGRAVPPLADAARRSRVREHVGEADRPGAPERRAERARRHRDRPRGQRCRRGRTATCCRRRSGCSRSRTRAR